MKIIKKPGRNFTLDSAHDGAGTKKVLVTENEIRHIQGITQSCLDAGGVFPWHKHDDCNECMYVLKGTGVVRDEDGEYPFVPGDLFIFSQGTYHEPRNTGAEMFKAIFIRIK